MNYKFAICLYGQPRDYKFGYNLIKNFIEMNNENTYDIFFHCWIDNNIKFEHSPWRTINNECLIINDSDTIKKDLIELYKPTLYEYEKPLNKNIILTDLSYISHSLAYTNSNINVQKNVYNILSQCYSRNKVKDILENYIINSNNNYDMVISTRFDGFNFPLNLKLTNIEKNKIYASSLHKPRYIIPDNFLIITTNIYLNWFNLFKNIKNIINNKKIENKLKNINEKLLFNMEELLLSNYLYYDYNIKDILYF